MFAGDLAEDGEIPRHPALLADVSRLASTPSAHSSSMASKAWQCPLRGSSVPTTRKGKASYRESSWLSTYFCGVIGLATSTDGIDDGEEFSCDMTDGHAVTFVHLMSVMVVNFGKARFV